MPIYEYHCDHCGDFEEMQRITDPPLVKCPRCKRKIRRLISNTSFQLKGSGWYVTDYARGANGGKKKDAAGDSGGGDAKSSEAKSESKSESGTGSTAESKPGSKSAGASKAATGGDKSAS
jgi:putative FmdB family regulatory protein